MDEFFGSDGLVAFYRICAIVGAVFFTGRTILMLIGLDSGDMGDAGDATSFETGHGHGGHGHDDNGDGGDGGTLRLLTFQGITAFMMMFGLTGLAFKSGSLLTPVWALLISLAVGVFAMWLVAFGFSLMRRMESSGTTGVDLAIGEEGTVYLRIPADGVGKVQVKIGQNLRVVDAMAEDKQEIVTGDRIIVSWVTDDKVLVVHRAGSLL